jgi:hypothetical protein
VCCRYGVFKVRTGRPAVRERPAPRAGLSKLNSVVTSRST